jgi:hypothetical protein
MTVVNISAAYSVSWMDFEEGGGIAKGGEQQNLAGTSQGLPIFFPL